MSFPASVPALGDPPLPSRTLVPHGVSFSSPLLVAHNSVWRGGQNRRTLHHSTHVGRVRLSNAPVHVDIFFLSVQFLRDDVPSAALAIWAYIVPAGAMNYSMLLKRDRWARFEIRSYRPPPRASDNALLLEESEVRSDKVRAIASSLNPVNSTEDDRFHLVHKGDYDTFFPSSLEILPVTLVQGIDKPALRGTFVPDVLPQSGIVNLPSNSFPTVAKRFRFLVLE